MYQTEFVEKIKTHILCSITFFFRKSCRLWDNVEKYCRAGQSTDGNMAHAHCVLHTSGYKHFLRICNINCFSTITRVARTRLIVTLKMHCLCCLSVLTSSLNKVHINLSVARDHKLDLRSFQRSVKVIMRGVVSLFPLYVLVCGSGTNISL